MTPAEITQAFNAFAAQSLHRGLFEAVAEIPILGSLMPYYLEPGTRIGDGRAVVERVAVAGDVLKAIDGAEREGKRVILLVMECPGGDAESGFEVYGRLRRFSESGGRVVAFVQGRNASIAPIVAQAADFIIMRADGKFAIHSVYGCADSWVEHWNTAMARVLAERTGMPLEKLVVYTSEVEMCCQMHDIGAVRLEWADWTPGTIELARNFAAVLAFLGRGAALPKTRRSRRLAAVAATALAAVGCGSVVDERAIAHNTQSSESSFMLPDVSLVTASSLGNLNRSVAMIAASNWTARTIGAGIYRGVAWNGSTLVAVGESSLAATSLEGSTWTSRTIPAGTYCAVVWGNSTFVAIGDGVAATSPDGITWTARTIPGGLYYAVIWTGSQFAAVGFGVCATSPDGITWTARTIPAGAWSALAWSGSTFVAMRTSQAATSPDGVTWTAHAMPVNAAGALVWSGAQFVAVGASGGAATSPDGITWTAQTIELSGGLRALVWSGQAFVAVGYAVGNTAGLFVSVDGVTWVRKPVASGAYNAVVWTGSAFVAVGENVCATSIAI
jgi:hypothetical protein